MNHKFKWSTLYLAAVLLILYWPIFYLVYYSFSAGQTMEKFNHFSMTHYLTLLADTRMVIIVINTVVIALLTAVIATMVGTLGAIAIHNLRLKKVRHTLLSFNNVLMVSPDVLIGASFLILFTWLGFGLGFWSVLLSHVAFSIPIVVLMVLPKLDGLSPSLVDAAMDLGASRFQAVVQVVIPAITPGIVAGFLMALTYSLDDFAVTFFVTGNGFSTLSVEIYSRARQGIDLEINALSTAMFLASLLLVGGYYLLSHHHHRPVVVKEGDVQ